MVTFKSILFSNHQPLVRGEKRKRIMSYDIARGLSVIFMILIHVMHNFGTHEFENSVPGLVIEGLGGPPAGPVFMFLMGLVYVYTSKDSLKSGLKRGMNLILLGYALNLFRGIVPYYLYGYVLDKPWGVLSDYYQLEFLIFEVDIIIFAGAAYLIMAMLYKIAKKPIVWLSVAAVVAIASPLVWNIGVDMPILKYPLSILWGNYILTTFPVFPWLVFPLVGMVVGGLLCGIEDRQIVFNKLALYGLIPFVVGIILVIIDIDGQYHQYNQMGLGAILAITGFIMLWQWLIEKITCLCQDMKKSGFIAYLSKHVLVVYCVHWVLIKWMWPFLPLDSYGFFGVMMITICVTVATMMLTEMYVRLNNPVKK